MPTRPAVDPGTIDAYLARLDVKPEPPSLAALDRLHRAHVERVPWETLWIHQGERWSIDPTASLARIANQGRGGYCFHLNGAFGTLLRALGYAVDFHVGGVHGPDGPTADAMTNHLVLTVRELPTDDHPAGVWYVDVGLGDALHHPLPLRSGAYNQGPVHIELAATPGEVGDWSLTNDPAGGFHGMAWRTGTTGMDAFEARHHILSTSPDSPFARVIMVQRRDATGVDTLRGRVLHRRGSDAGESLLNSRQHLTDALADVFGIDPGTVDGNRLDALWDHVQRAHEAWLARLET